MEKKAAGIRLLIPCCQKIKIGTHTVSSVQHPDPRCTNRRISHLSWESVRPLRPRLGSLRAPCLEPELTGALWAYMWDALKALQEDSQLRTCALALLSSVAG